MTLGTLSLYISRQFIFWLTSVFLGLVSLLALFDIIELFRRTSNKQVDLYIILQMAGAKLPHLAQDTLPFIILFASMLTFWRLAKSSELIVARAAGISVWQIITPVVIIAFLIGIFQILAFSPFASMLRAQYEFLETKHLHKDNNQLTVSQTGLWLRQGHQAGQAVIHARRALDETGQVLQDVNIFILEKNSAFSSRIDADEAILKPGYWEINNARVADAAGHSEEVATYRLPTKLTGKKIQDGFASADSLSLWALPDFIKTLKEAGFNATNHRLRFHTLIATPVLLCAMTLVAAVFSVQINRRASAFYTILGGISCGFLLYLLTNVVHALGLSTNLPTILAAWMPAGVSTMLGITALLHLEDG